LRLRVAFLLHCLTGSVAIHLLLTQCSPIAGFRANVPLPMHVLRSNRPVEWCPFGPQILFQASIFHICGRECKGAVVQASVSAQTGASLLHSLLHCSALVCFSVDMIDVFSCL